MLFDVANEPDHVLGDEAADGAARVYADDHGAARVKDEPSRLHVAGLWVDERARGRREHVCIGAVSDKEGEAVLADRLACRCLVVDGDRYRLGPELGERSWAR